MSQIVENHPKRWKWRLEWAVQVGLECLVGWLPGGWVFRLGGWLGGLTWYLMPGRRAIVLRNLRIAYAGEHDLESLRQIARESFRRTGANMFSAAHTARLHPAQLRQVVELENLDLLEQLLADGHGVVLLLAHMGNWELLSRFVHLFPPGTRTGAFYRPLNNPLLDQRVRQRREADGTRMFSKRDNPHHVAGFLREGAVVGILADQRVGPQGELGEFFGRRTRCSPLPSLLARRSKSQLLALSLTTAGVGKWRARFIPVAATRTTPDCMVALEQAMRLSPEDVFWFQDRWKVYVSPEYTIQHWIGATLSVTGKRHRALIWLADAPTGWQLPPTWLHPDVDYELAVTATQSPPAWLPATTPTHPVPPNGERDELRQRIAAIDAAAPLPVDFVITSSALKALAKACRREGIPLVSLPMGSVPAN